MAGTKDAILMVECGAKEVSEDVMVEALLFGHKAMQPLIELQERMAQESGKKKADVPLFPLQPELVDQMSQKVSAGTGSHSRSIHPARRELFRRSKNWKKNQWRN